MTGLLLSVGVVLVAALGMLAADAFRAKHAQRACPYVSLAALTAAFVLSTTWPTGPGAPQAPSAQLLPDELGRLLRALLLLGATLHLLLELPVSPAPTDRAASCAPVAAQALRLLSVLGGLLALSADDLLLLALGVTLYAVCSGLMPEGEHKDPAGALPPGLGMLFFGLALLYASTATLSLQAMGAWLWQHPGPQAAMFYLGGGLCATGAALLAGLIGPAITREGRGALGAVVGVGVLLRLCVGALGALQHLWLWPVALTGLLALAAGWLNARRLSRAHAPAAQRLQALDAAQRGWLLLTVAYAGTRAGWQAVWMGLTAYWLGEIIRSAAARQLPGDDYGALLARNLWLGISVLMSLLSLAGTPLTVGFAARAGLLRAAQDVPLLVLALVGLLLSELCAAEYLPFAIAIVRSRAQQERLACPGVVCAVLLVLAMALLVLGVYPQIFATWVSLLG